MSMIGEREYRKTSTRSGLVNGKPPIHLRRIGARPQVTQQRSANFGI
jgi:hypothetical protein